MYHENKGHMPDAQIVFKHQSLPMLQHNISFSGSQLLLLENFTDKFNLDPSTVRRISILRRVSERNSFRVAEVYGRVSRPLELNCG